MVKHTGPGFRFNCQGMTLLSLHIIKPTQKLGHDYASIDKDHLPCDVARIVRGEK
jgi:hypothetical protein